MWPRDEDEAEHDALKQAEWERQEAYKAVAKALSSYRWWGWRSISNSVRMFITSIKLRLGMRLWP